jgi:Glycogen recognition site of AMP-activated protein kinase
VSRWVSLGGVADGRNGVCGQVAGLDVGWGQRLDLILNMETHRFELQRELPPGKFPFKFIIDDCWTCSADQPSLLDGFSRNNYVEVGCSHPSVCPPVISLLCLFSYPIFVRMFVKPSSGFGFLERAKQWSSRSYSPFLAATVDRRCLQGRCKKAADGRGRCTDARGAERNSGVHSQWQAHPRATHTRRCVRRQSMILFLFIFLWLYLALCVFFKNLCHVGMFHN